ncbi:ABC transporter ATP-binding protein [Lactovum odontotermitis]
MGVIGENATPDDNIAIRVSHVSKYFKLPTEPTNSLRRAVVNRFKGIKGYRRQEVLKDISFDIEKGDFFGIVGRNGSGKSTLLKIISRIYKPNAGSVEINGRLVSFIELGVGFNDELSGRENVYLNGAMLGFSTTEVDEMYDEIVEFSELQDFMDQKLKNYSSGMQVRLAFSVAIKAKGDILVLDEVLAVGDEAFQKKCDNFFKAIKGDKSKTIVLVTHDMNAVRKYCNKAMLIDSGNIIESGKDVEEISWNYSKLFLGETKQIDPMRMGDGSVRFEKYDFQFDDSRLLFNFKIKNYSDQDFSGNLDFGIVFYQDGKNIVGNHLISDKRQGLTLNSSEMKDFSVEVDNHFSKETFTVDIFLYAESGEHLLDRVRAAFMFENIFGKKNYGNFVIPIQLDETIK